MEITRRQHEAANKKATLYGVRFEGMQERPRGKSPVYMWTDQVTGTTFATYTIKSLPAEVIKRRRKFAREKNRGKRPRRRNASPRARALELSKAFHGLPARKIHRFNLDWPEAAILLGACARLEYYSEKWDGKGRIYYHDFGRPCSVYAAESPQKDGSNLLLIHGHFEVRPEGITG